MDGHRALWRVPGGVDPLPPARSRCGWVNDRLVDDSQSASSGASSCFIGRRNSGSSRGERKNGPSFVRGIQ
jgi:hypothetical protein